MPSFIRSREEFKFIPEEPIYENTVIRVYDILAEVDVAIKFLATSPKAASVAWRIIQKFDEKRFECNGDRSCIAQVDLETYDLSDNVSEEDLRDIRDILRHIQSNFDCSHPNIVAPLGALMIDAPECVAIVYPYYQATLQDVIDERQQPDHPGYEWLLEMSDFVEKNLRAILNDILRGIAHIHSQSHDCKHLKGCMHRDITPQNVLIKWKCETNHSEGLVASITDFGSSRPIRDFVPWWEDTVKEDCGVCLVTAETTTLSAQAPESVFATFLNSGAIEGPDALLSSHWYQSQASDIWAFGILATELALSQISFAASLQQYCRGADISTTFAKQFFMLGFPSQETWPELFEGGVSPINGKSFIDWVKAEHSALYNKWLEGNGIPVLRRELSCIDKDVVDLILSCLTFNPRHRPTADEGINFKSHVDSIEPEKIEGTV